MATPQQGTDFTNATKVSITDLAERVGILTVEREKILLHLNSYIDRFNEAQETITALNAQNAALGAAQTAQTRTLEGTASTVNEAATA
jgi:hypothetical protein